MSPSFKNYGTDHGIYELFIAQAMVTCNPYGAMVEASIEVDNSQFTTHYLPVFQWTMKLQQLLEALR